MSAATVQPAKADPKEKPANIVITAAFLDRLGMYSDVSAIAFGMAPPIPNPVNMRYPINCDTDVAVAVINDPMPNVNAHAMSTGLRPKRSASGPKMSAPIIMPKVPLETTGPNTGRGTWSWALNTGRTGPMTCASNPSMNT